jgi:HEAT repeat protein
MRKRLDDIRWGELHAAYGPAEWVPEALRGLVDPDPEVRETSLGWIHGGTFHQQTADEATPHVVPFLIELAGDPATPDRHRLLHFLAELMIAGSIDPVADQEADDRARAAQIREYEAWPHGSVTFYQAQWRACQAAAWNGADVLLGLLDDGDPRVRAAAGLVLALLVKDGNAVAPPEAPGVVGRLREAVGGEADPIVRAGQVMAMGTAASRHPEARGWLREIEAAAELGDPAGLAAGLRLIDLGEAFDEAAAHRFVGRILRFDAVACRVLPWWSEPDSFEEPGSYTKAEAAIRRRFARLAADHPGLVGRVRSRAAAGPPAERANALRLLFDRKEREGGPDGGPPIPVEPGADLVVRLAAAQAEVSRIPDGPSEPAMPAVMEALAHPDASLRLRAARVLASLDTGAVAARVEHLAEILQEERDPSVLKALARAIGQHRRHDGTILEPFLPLLQRWLEATDGPRDRSVRRALWERLISLAEIVPAGAVADWVADRIDLPGPDRAEAVELFRSLERPEWEMGPRLARLLREDPDPKVRRAAVLSPGHAPSTPDRLPPADAVLAALRDDPSESVRAAAAEALAAFLMDTEHDPAMAGAIVRALAAALDDDPSWRVRREAATNLGLAAPTRDEAQDVRSRQVSRHAALGQSSPGDEEAVRALVRAAGRDPRHDVLSAVSDSLQKVAAAVPGLISLLRSDSSRARAGAAEALASVDKPAAIAALPDLFHALLDEPDAAARHRIARAVGSLIIWGDATPWIDPLKRALQCPDDAVRHWMAWGLTHAGPGAAPLAVELAGCLRSGSESLRRHALETLAGIGPGAADTLPAVMERVRSSPIGEHLVAIKAAWSINGDRAPCLGELLEALERLARDAAANVRAAAIRQAGTIAAGLGPDRPERDRAVALLRAARADDHPDVRTATDRALQVL